MNRIIPIILMLAACSSADPLERQKESDLFPKCFRQMPDMRVPPGKCAVRCLNPRYRKGEWSLWNHRPTVEEYCEICNHPDYC